MSSDASLPSSSSPPPPPSSIVVSPGLSSFASFGVPPVSSSSSSSSAFSSVNDKNVVFNTQQPFMPLSSPSSLPLPSPSPESSYSFPPPPPSYSGHLDGGRDDKQEQQHRTITVEEIFDFPIGYLFLPTDGELIQDFLIKKLLGQPLPSDVIPEFELYSRDADQLPGNIMFGYCKERYYFTVNRPSRSTPSGFWKATDRDQPIRDANMIGIGIKKTLVFYQGKAPNGTKTNWTMEEYKIDPELNQHFGIDDSKAENYVLCKVYDTKSRSDMSPHSEDSLDDMSSDAGSDTDDEEVEDTTEEGVLREIDQACEAETTVNPEEWELNLVSFEVCQNYFDKNKMHQMPPWMQMLVGETSRGAEQT